MIEVLATAFAHLAIVIAADWSSPERTIGCQVVGHLAKSPADIAESFINCARGMATIGIAGSIRPEWSPTGFMFGHWGF